MLGFGSRLNLMDLLMYKLGVEDESSKLVFLEEKEEDI